MKTYILNPALERIPLDEAEEVLHDHESGDIHYLDDISTVIINLLGEAMTADALIEKLTSMFEGDPDVIRTDTLRFLGELTEKKILLEGSDEN